MEYENNSNLMGYVGAIVGAIIGAIPFGIGVWYGWFLGPAAVVSAYVSYFVFKKFGGEAKPETKFVIAIITLAAILFTNYVMFQMVASDVGVTLQQMIDYDETRAIMLETVGMSLLFGAIGSVYIFRQIQEEEV